MSQLPPQLTNIASVTVKAPIAQKPMAPQLLLYVNSQYVPCHEVQVTLSAYGVADTVRGRVFFHGLPDYMKGVSLFQQSQKVRPCPVVVKVINHATGNGPFTVFTGWLDELDADLDQDEIEIRCRGILAPVIDQRLSLKLEQNVDIGAALSALMSKYGIKSSVPFAGITVGHVLDEDHVSHARNLRAFDFARSIADAIGWTIRVQGSTVIIGPPPDRTAVKEFVRYWGNDVSGFTTLKVTHNALHSHDVRVKVLSYLPRTKGRGVSLSQGATAVLLGLPPPLSTSSNSGGGRQSSGFTPEGESVAIQNEWVFHLPNLTTAQCDAIASKIREDITTREFVLDAEWTPTDAELKPFADAGCEWTMRLQGVSDPVLNQGYFPREFSWVWSVDAGLKMQLKANNIPLPEDSGAGGTF